MIAVEIVAVPSWCGDSSIIHLKHRDDCREEFHSSKLVWWGSIIHLKGWDDVHLDFHNSVMA